MLGFGGSVVAQTAPTAAVKNVVLVHGAWADGSGWKGVYDILVKDGYNVSIVQEPETSFADDVAATKFALERLNGSAPMSLRALHLGDPDRQLATEIRGLNPE